MIQPSAQLALREAAKQVLWVVASLCFDHVGLAVSEATTVQAEYVCRASSPWPY